MMNTYLLNFWDTVRSSYWFVPSLFGAGALFFSFALPQADWALIENGVQLPEWILTTTDTARVTLSTMAGAMIAVTGTVFSITIVTLSLASQQFGPRLLRRFMFDLPTQITLGVFLATGFYCLLLLRVVENREGDIAAPHLSVFGAVVLAVLSMGMLIMFIHHVAMLIQAPNVVAAVTIDLDNAIARLFPEKIGEPVGEEQLKDDAAREQEARLGDECIVIRSTCEGYIQAMADDSLMHLACTNNLVLRLRSRPGDFISINSPLVNAWPANDKFVEELNSEDLAEALNDTVIVGIRRTPRQDVECAVDELVEVAVRSLSPGINDPFTAINCIDHLGASLGRLSERCAPTAFRCDDKGQLRVITRPVSFSDVLDAAFNQIRQHSRGSVAVTIRLLEALASIAEHVQRDEDRKAIKLHADMISRLSDSQAEEHDKQGILERSKRITELLNVSD